MTRVGPKCWALWLAILSLAILHPSLAAAQEKLSRSPVNPAFEQYQAARQSGMARTMTADGHVLGYVPAPLNLKHTVGQRALIPHPLYGPPSSYDLRTHSKLTAVRDQGQCGSCWTFGTFASLESCLLTNETWDFSENNLKNTHGFDNGPCDGGDVLMSAAYLSRWSGPATEVADPYHPWDDRPSPTVSAVKHVQEVLFLPLRANAADNDTIKQTIMTYGAVTTSFYYDGAYYNSGNYAYYCNSATYANHEVAIVGWDDNFDKSKFNNTPPGNGAFIMKNSWGAGWGQSGYFYISYYDAQVGMNENAVFENAESTANYAHVYQYDPLGWVSGLGAGNTTAWFANVFMAGGAEQLKAVSFYAGSANSSYEVYIYLNPSSPPIGGSSVSSMTGTISYPGYHTLTLTTPVALTAGQTFSVVIKLTTPGYNWPIPIEYAYPGYSSGATAAAGQSYLSIDGASWLDATRAWDPTCNVCIKAFTAVPGNITVTPGTLDFGMVTTGVTAQASFTVTNSVGTTISNGTATVSGPPSGGFTIVSGATFSVPGFGSTNVVVQFAPTSLGVFTGSVVFATANGGGSSNIVIGTGESTVPVAGFTGSPTLGLAPLDVTFIDSSTGIITNRFWDFGDGSTTNFAVATNPGHTYSTGGTYNVSLTVSGLVNTSTMTRSNYIVVAGLGVSVCQEVLPVPQGVLFGSVVAGQTYCYLASGCIEFIDSQNPPWSSDPDGNISTNNCTTFFPYPMDNSTGFKCNGLVPMSLVGKINGGACFQLGSAGSFVATNSGTLTLYFNDDWWSDNTNSWYVCISACEPKLVVTPTNLNFGVVTVGQTKSLNFSVINTNPASGPLIGTATSTAPFAVTSGGTYNVTGGHAQTVTITFAPSSVGILNGSVIFTSNGGDLTNGVAGVGFCSYALSSNSASSLAKGGTNTVNVITTSPCPWSATPGNAWLTILSGDSGVGSGTVTYVVAGNSSSNARTGTVSIAGLTFTVTQVGNTAPQVSIAPVATVTLPVRTVNLSATVTDDGAPSGTVSVVWSKVSGPGSVVFGNANATNTTATFATNGTYVLRLTASDGVLSTSSNATAIVNAPPEITSPPTATNILAQVDNLPVVAGVAGLEPSCLTVGMFDPDFNALYCFWDFGDGAQSAGIDCNPCHVFTNCGQYAVSVEVSDGFVSTNAAGLVTVACPMTVTKMRVKVNFAKQYADSASLSAILDNLDAGYSMTNMAVTLNIGGAQVPFTLDAKGKGKGVSRYGSCKLARNKKTGLWALKAKLAKGTWREPWLAHGLVNQNVKPGVWVIMPVVVVIGDGALANERPMLYTAKAGKSGSAK